MGLLEYQEDEDRKLLALQKEAGAMAARRWLIRWHDFQKLSSLKKSSKS